MGRHAEPGRADAQPGNRPGRVAAGQGPTRWRWWPARRREQRPLRNMTGSDRQYLWGQRHLALEKAEVSALYHQKRERFFELLDKYSKATSLLCGSAALWKIANPRVVEAMALAITFLSALSLVFSFSERSKRHAELARGFCLVAGDIVKLGRDFLDADVNRWNESLYKLDASEPPSSRKMSAYGCWRTSSICLEATERRRRYA